MLGLNPSPPLGIHANECSALVHVVVFVKLICAINSMDYLHFVSEESRRTVAEMLLVFACGRMNVIFVKCGPGVKMSLK